MPLDKTFLHGKEYLFGKKNNVNNFQQERGEGVDLTAQLAAESLWNGAFHKEAKIKL